MSIRKKSILYFSISLIILILSAVLTFSNKSFANAPVSISAQAHVENIGWKNPEIVSDETIIGTTGEHKKLEALKLSSSQADQYSFSQQAHVENIGWQNTVGNDEVSGTTGQNNGIEALILTQQGALANGKELRYRAHVENFGWTNWVKSGEPVGTTGYAYQIEALQIGVFEKDQVPQLPAGNVNWGFLNKSASKKDVDYTEVLSISQIYPHDETSFLEGLSFYNNRLYESSGRYGKSMLYKNIDLPTNQAELQYKFPDDIFAEGSVVHNGKLYVLTYKENKVFVFDPESLELVNTLNYRDREGWGLTSDGQNLIASDGSSHIYYMDEACNDVKVLNVTYNGQPVSDINELEYINGYIWANVWHTRDVLVINKDTGEVIKKIDCSTMYTGPGEVMNGIAYNPTTNKVYLTGKWWSQLLEFDLKPGSLL